MTAPAGERVVVADRHPATVLDPEGSVVDGARVVLTRDELFVFVVRATGVVELARERWSSEESTLGRNAWRVGRL